MQQKILIYSVEFEGFQTLVQAPSIERAKNFALTEWGRSRSPYEIHQATEEEIAWVKGMGGMIHEA